MYEDSFDAERQGNSETFILLIATGNTRWRDELEALGSGIFQSSFPPVTNGHLPDGTNMTMNPNVICIVNLSYFVEELTEVIIHIFKCRNIDSKVCVTKT